MRMTERRRALCSLIPNEQWFPIKSNYYKLYTSRCYNSSTGHLLISTLNNAYIVELPDNAIGVTVKNTAGNRISAPVYNVWIGTIWTNISELVNDLTEFYGGTDCRTISIISTESNGTYKYLYVTVDKNEINNIVYKFNY